MATEPNNLTDFASRIDPYLNHYWRSLLFACMAVQVGQEWIQFAGKAALSTELCDPNPVIKRIVDLAGFRAYSARLETNVFHPLIDNLRNSVVIAGMPDDPLRLVPTGSRPYSWHPWHVQGSQWRARSDNEWPSVLAVHGSGSILAPFPPQDVWLEVDAQLRRHDPPYNGFAALCARLGLQFDQFGSHNPHFNLYAELPARFVEGVVRRKEKQLALTIKQAGSIELFMEWLPNRETERRSVRGSSQSPFQYERVLSIPPGATELKANLLAMEWDADKISVRVDWENILLRICEFFDPRQSNLTDFLFSKTNPPNANPFELGVARLLGLAGYTVLWFGKGAKDALPDLVAYLRQPLGAERIIYGECTLKNPAEKFSDLSKRADGLHQHLGLEAGTILPVVFVRNETTTQDHKAASALGLVVCDGSELKRLQDKITSDASPDDVFESLGALRGNSVIFGDWPV